MKNRCADRNSAMSIYEVHAGSWKRKDGNEYLSYRELADDLIPYAKWMGFTHIELLPIFCKNMKYDENWIIGGSEIYKKSLEMGIVKKVYITEIHEEHECDSYFPELNYEYFELNSSVEDECDGVRLTNKIFCKKLKKS